VPFVQGQLRSEYLEFSIETQCAHCQEPIHIEIDSDLSYRVLDSACAPVIHVPLVDLRKLEEPSIIDAF
jgi:hypothetical protein